MRPGRRGRLLVCPAIGDQVQITRGYSQLPQHGVNLTAMLRSMVYNVQNHLPDRGRIRHAAQSLVRDFTVPATFSDTFRKADQPAQNVHPGGAEIIEAAGSLIVGASSRGPFFETREPDAIGLVQMHYG